MSFLAPSSSVPNTPPPKPAAHLRFSSSLQGRPKAIGWGRCRVAVNCTWYAGFYSDTVSSSSSGASSGGKGFLAGSSEASSQPTTTYRYYVDVIFSICQGPIVSIPTLWRNKHAGPLRRLSLYKGALDQSPASYLAQNYPSQALAYRGEAYLLGGSYPLGSSSSLPNISVEVVFGVNGGGYDANPADVITDFLTNPTYGISFDPALLGDFGPARNYWGALGLNVSTVLTEQVAGNSWLQDLAAAINFEFVWSGGKLAPVPYADSSEAGNGYTFTISTTPVYDLTADDFVTNQGSIGSGTLDGDTSVVIARKPRADMDNRVRLEFLDRSQQYNPATVEAADEASIVAYGERPSELRQAHMFATRAAASHSASLQLARAQIAATYQFTLNGRFVLLDPMDVVTLTEPALGLVRQPVRITEIQENDDRTLTITADEYHGTITAPLYDRDAGAGAQTDFNADPGSINPPLIFEPPYQLAGDLAVWCAISGIDLVNWGGCNVFVSSDGASYSQVGTIYGPARMGATTGALPTITAAVTGPTIDTVHPLGVDLSQSGGKLVSASQNDMLAANTAFIIGSEVVAYQNATLTAANRYTLGPLLRGAYGTPITDHPAGAPIARLDDDVFKYPYTPDRIGSTIYLKFQSFNPYGGATQDLSTVGAIPYTITGSPLAGTLATPQNVRTVFSAGFQQLAWDEIDDFRAGVRYRVYRGDSAATALNVGEVAHPPFVLPGTGTYFVTAYCVPIIGLAVSSAASAPISIVGNMLVANPLQTFDQAPEGWAGTLQNLTLQGVSPTQYLALASGAMSGTYTVPAQDVIDLGYVGVLALNVSWKAVGVPIGQSILDVPDFLAQTDVLGAAASQYVDAFVEVRVGVPGSPDVYSAEDVYQLPNVYDPPITWGPWQKFLPGNYPGRYANFRITVKTTNAQVTGYIVTFAMQASVPTRIDHFQGLTIPAEGRTITFQPEGASMPAKFNGGPNNAALPYYNITHANSQSGDVVKVLSLTLQDITIQVLNGGSGVTRSGLNLDVQGY